jgi:hypothetical protein
MKVHQGLNEVMGQAHEHENIGSKDPFQYKIILANFIKFSLDTHVSRHIWLCRFAYFEEEKLR